MKEEARNFTAVPCPRAGWTSIDKGIRHTPKKEIARFVEIITRIKEEQELVNIGRLFRIPCQGLVHHEH